MCTRGLQRKPDEQHILGATYPQFLMGIEQEIDLVSKPLSLGFVHRVAMQ